MEFVLKLSFALIIACVLNEQVKSQTIEERFIVTVAEYDPPRVPFQNALNICYATAISARHVITTATCATRITRQVKISLRYSALILSQTTSSKVFIHPDFIANRPHENNIAIFWV